MSGEGELDAIKREFEDAKKTARVYLRAVEVLDPDKISATKNREREIGRMADAILGNQKVARHMPNDPDTRRAATLACRYLHYGHDPEVLKDLLEWSRYKPSKQHEPHPAYRLALGLAMCGLLIAGADIPKPLRSWARVRPAKKARWRPKGTRNYRIGMVVEAMASGTNILIRSAPEPAGVDAILPDPDLEWRKTFPNLRPTRDDATADKYPAYSICDAVAKILTETRKTGSGYRTVLRGWNAYRRADWSRTPSGSA